MRKQSSAFVPDRVPFPALVWGGLGVLAFSLTLPATRAALPAFGPVTVGIGRAVPAAVLAAAALLLARAARPTRPQCGRLLLVSAGAVVGFPIFTALALRGVGAAHGAVLVGLLPVATAVAAVLRAGERPRPAFWLTAGAGAAAVLVFAAVRGAGAPRPADRCRWCCRSRSSASPCTRRPRPARPPGSASATSAG
jgi:drug/metabolite transporter (DMT)-like permease